MSSTMESYFDKIEVGDVVEYIGCSVEQIRWGNNDAPSMLIVGREYIVSNVEIHSQHTKISIAHKNGKFNSVCFRKVSSG